VSETHEGGDDGLFDDEAGAADERIALWLSEQRAAAGAFLRAGRVVQGRLDGAPAWAAPPLAVLWAVRAGEQEGRVGWLVLGDVPADFLAAATVNEPREAVRAFAARWTAAAAAAVAGEAPPAGLDLGPRPGWSAVSRLHRQRADAFARWAADEARW
jgi:hypothetical protein